MINLYAWFRMPHKCHGNAQNCPSRPIAQVWEMPINELDRNRALEFIELSKYFFVDFFYLYKNIRQQ